jgi:hypothetical protein
MGIEALDLGGRIVGAIHSAAKATGAGFDYLLKTAMRESNLNPDVKAKTSSATGLFQFIDQTWLSTMKESGPALGYGKYANAITRTSSGKYVVNDPAMRAEIMALRKDPTANSLMGGAFTQSNAKVLTSKLGRAPTDGELYIAHFLGANGASKFIRTAEANPNAKAASYFPRAAQANKGIFYKDGAARTMAQTYAALVSKHNKTPIAAPTTAVAAATPTAPTQTSTVTPTRSIPVPAAPPVVSANAAVQPITPMSYVDETRPDTRVARIASSAFHGMFQTEERGAVAPVVRELWGVKPAGTTELTTAVAPTSSITVPGEVQRRHNAPLDLFRFLRPGVRAAT